MGAFFTTTAHTSSSGRNLHVSRIGRIHALINTNDDVNHNNTNIEEIPPKYNDIYTISRNTNDNNISNNINSYSELPPY